MRKQLEPSSAWEPIKPTFIIGLLEWLHADTAATIVEEMSSRLDAVLEFAVFVTREFLVRNYKVEKYDSDIFDLFQLQHLAFDRFVIVSGDPDLFIRTRRSPQASRIMTFDAFLRSL